MTDPSTRRVCIRPAMLRGQRVDFWDGPDWCRLCPGWRPASGYWRTPADNRIWAALDRRQSLIAATAVRLFGRVLALRVLEARAAERGEVQGWTIALTPLPPAAAEAELLGR